MDELLSSRIKGDESTTATSSALEVLCNNVDTLLWSISEKDDGELYYERVNSAFAAVEGLLPEHYVGKRISEVHPPAQCKAIRNSFEWAKRGKIHTYEVEFGEGEEKRYFDIRITPIPDNNGVIRRFVGSGTDTTKLKSLQAELQKINDELEIRIGNRTEELKKARDELEVKVQERTKELLKTNDALHAEIDERKRVELLRQVKARLLDELRNAESIKDCLILGCEAIRDAGLFMRAIFTTKNNKGETTHFAQVGLEEAFVAELSKRPPTSKETIKKMLEPRFKISHSFFVPSEAGIDFNKTGRYILQEVDVEEGPGAWKRGDELFVPMLRMDGSIESFLSVDTPMNGKRPDLATILYLEDIVDIVARQIHEIENLKALRDSEERYRVLTDSALVGVYIYDKGRLLFVNQAMEQITGYSKKELLNMNTKRLEVPDQLKTPEMWAEIKQQEDAKTHNYSMHLFRKDGRIAILEFKTHPIIYGGMNVTLGNCVDITERRTAEDEVARQLTYLKIVNEFAIDLAAAPPDIDLFILVAEKLRQITNSMAVGISSYDPISEQLSIQHIAIENPLLAKVNYLLGQNIKNIRMRISPEIRTRMLAEVVGVSEDLSETMFGAVSKPIGITIRKALGIRDFTGLALQHGGRLVGSILIVKRNESSELSNEVLHAFANVVAVALLRKKSEDALRESEEKYRILADGANDGIAIIQNLELKYVNPRLADMLGYSADEMIGTRGTDYVFSDEIPRLVDLQKKRMAGENVSSIYETALRTKVGKKLVVEVNACKINYDGKAASLIFYRDISERKIAEESLRRERETFSIIAEGAIHSENAPDLCHRILSGLVKTLGFDVGSVQLYDPKERTLNLKAMSGVWADKIFNEDPPQHIDDPQYVGTMVAKTKTPIFAPDIVAHPIYQTHSKRIDENGVRALISWPLLGADRNLIGIIQLMALTTKEIPNKDKVFFENVVEMFAMALDRRMSEEALKESEARSRSFFENSTIGLYRTTPDGRILMTNHALQKMLGYSSFEEFADRSLESEGYEPEYSRSDFKKNIERDEKITGLESTWHKRDGTEIFVRESARVVRDAKGKPIYYEGTVEDITERRHTEEALQESEERFRTLVENLREGFIIYDTVEDIIVYHSPGTIQMLGVPSETIKNKKLNDFLKEIVCEDDLVDILIAFRTASEWRKSGFSESLRLEFRIKKTGMDVCWIELISYPLSGKAGIGALCYLILLDITERKLAEEQVKLSLQEKEILLKEVHHRVKNNLQIVSSLLHLQIDTFCGDTKTVEVFRVARDRIKSIALIHEKLYKCESLARVDFASYIKSLIDSLRTSYSINHNARKINLILREVSLDITKAIPCALILNELVTNCIKHAFPNGREGEIRVEVFESEEFLHLIVSDDGIGLPEDFNSIHSETMGIELIKTITSQLSGKVYFESKCGTTVHIAFPLSKYNETGGTR